MSAKNNHINYIEFRATDLAAIKTFYSAVFGWQFTDYGPNYISFGESGIAGGFEKSTDKIVNGALVVILHNELEITLQRVKDAGGKITKEIFSFPGGRRFQFLDPAGNELAVWCEE